MTLGKKVITECAKEFCKIIELNGYKAGVYANLNWFTNYIDVEQIKQFKIWLAQWNNKPTASFNINYWQYTSKGSLNGISGNVDMNYCYDDILKQVENVEKPVENVDKPVDNFANNDLQEIVYIVKKGDNLTKIASMYGTTVQELVRLNAIKNPNLIYPNQKIIIKTKNNTNTESVYYIVKKGDNLTKIAYMYGTTVQELVRLNAIKNPNLIYPNQKLKIR